MAVSVKLSAKIDSRLRALARHRNCSQHYMMVEAITRFVESEEARLNLGGECPPPPPEERVTVAE